MAPAVTGRSTFAVSEFSDSLSPAWQEFLLNRHGKLKWKAVKDQYARGGVLPEPFLTQFRAKFPGVQIPTQGSGTGYDGPADQPREALSGEGSGEGHDDPDDITNGGQREFSWLTSAWRREDDSLNRRRENGTLEPLTTPGGAIIEGDITIDPNENVPAELLTREMLDHWSALNDLNGTLYYDPERYAMGTLSSEEYMLIPSNLPIEVCPIEHIGGGLHVYAPNILVMSGVYMLAKEQAVNLKLNDQDQLKWACLRLEAFKAGWFDHQRYTAYKPMPRNSVTTFVEDGKAIMDYLRQAWPLCAFLPYLSEFYFRAYGGSYNKSSAVDYVAKAQKLAAGASLGDFLGYLNQDLLYGKVLAWIGVKRPMLALLNEQACQSIPNVFKIRKSAAPAGQALITTSATIIDALRSAHWWEGITKTGNYDDVALMTVAGKIRASPWKYHLMSYSYELPPLTAEEQAEVNEASAQAKMFAPILQAYIDAVSKSSDIGRAQALKKHSGNNESLYSSALGLFRQAKRQKGRNVAELFANTIFGVKETPARIEDTNAPPP